jgi:SIR2-like domain
MPSTIQRVPDIPPALKHAAKVGRLVPFVGAGASRLAGCPSWDGFADGILKQLVQRKALNYGDLEQIRAKNLGPRVRLSLARTIARKQKIDLDFEAIIQGNSSFENPDGRRLYLAIAKLSTGFVTTNYDYWLDIPFDQRFPQVDATPSEQPVSSEPTQRNVYFAKADISFARLQLPNTVIHLHGSLRDPKSMVVTTRDYLEQYRNETGKENGTLAFLRTLFKERVVLFVGYGMDELEILEYVILKHGLGRPNNHFLLLPFFSHEEKIAEYLTAYFQDECGVTLLPYLCDDNNYDQLIDVVERFAQEIPAQPLIAIQRQRDMEAVLE